MDRILKILKKENGPRASSAPVLELNTIIFKHVYWYMQQISGERLQDHLSSGFKLLPVPKLGLLNEIPQSRIKNIITAFNVVYLKPKVRWPIKDDLNKI